MLGLVLYLDRFLREALPSMLYDVLALSRTAASDTIRKPLPSTAVFLVIRAAVGKLDCSCESIKVR